MFNSSWSRRKFLTGALISTAMLLNGTSASAKIRNNENLPEGKLSLYNTHNGERLTVTYRNPLGEYDPEAIKALNWILRCHYTQQAVDMDLRVIEYLNRVDKNLGGNNEIHIISGFRSPEYNGLLRKEGRHVAKNSLHMKGKAIDISIPHVGTHTLRQTAFALGYGGVGYYPSKEFVHLDSGVFRAW